MENGSMNHWLKIALLSSLPVLSHAHTVSPYILPEAFDITTSNLSFQSGMTVEKFYTPTANFKTTYVITEPNGEQKALNPAASLKRFNVAEFDLKNEGTYKIQTKDALGNSFNYALVDGRWLRVRPVRTPMPQAANAAAPKPEAPKAEVAKAPAPAQIPRIIAADQVPANAQKLEVKNQFIAESYVTKGKPSPIPAPTKKGFELKLLTHPSELYVGDSLKAQVLFNGKAVPNLEFEVFKGAGHFDKDKTRELPSVKSNAKGEIVVPFDKAGIYLITASYPEANPDNTKKPSADAFIYGLTVEVAE
jgi:hypothetical protein